MITFERSTDYALIRRILTHPRRSIVSQAPARIWLESKLAQQAIQHEVASSSENEEYSTLRPIPPRFVSCRQIPPRGENVDYAPAFLHLPIVDCFRYSPSSRQCDPGSFRQDTAPRSRRSRQNSSRQRTLLCRDRRSMVDPCRLDIRTFESSKPKPYTLAFLIAHDSIADPFAQKSGGCKPRLRTAPFYCVPDLWDSPTEHCPQHKDHLHQFGPSSSRQDGALKQREILQKSATRAIRLCLDRHTAQRHGVSDVHSGQPFLPMICIQVSGSCRGADGPCSQSIKGASN